MTRCPVAAAALSLLFLIARIGSAWANLGNTGYTDDLCAAGYYDSVTMINDSAGCLSLKPGLIINGSSDTAHKCALYDGANIYAYFPVDQIDNATAVIRTFVISVAWEQSLYRNPDSHYADLSIGVTVTDPGTALESGDQS